MRTYPYTPSLTIPPSPSSYCSLAIPSSSSTPPPSILPTPHFVNVSLFITSLYYHSTLLCIIHSFIHCSYLPGLLQYDWLILLSYFLFYRCSLESLANYSSSSSSSVFLSSTLSDHHQSCHTHRLSLPSFFLPRCLIPLLPPSLLFSLSTITHSLFSLTITPLSAHPSLTPLPVVISGLSEYQKYDHDTCSSTCIIAFFIVILNTLHMISSLSPAFVSFLAAVPTYSPERRLCMGRIETPLSHPCPRVCSQQRNHAFQVLPRSTTVHRLPTRSHSSLSTPSVSSVSVYPPSHLYHHHHQYIDDLPHYHH